MKIEREQRKPVCLVLQMTDYAWDSAVDVVSLNLSKGGMFVRTETPFSRGSLVKFKMDAPGGEAVSGVGKVAWQRGADKDTHAPAGIGLRFVKLSSDGIARINEILSNVDDEDDTQRIEYEEKVIVAVRDVIQEEAKKRRESSERKGERRPRTAMWILGLVLFAGIVSGYWLLKNNLALS